MTSIEFASSTPNAPDSRIHFGKSINGSSGVFEKESGVVTVSRRRIISGCPSSGASASF